MWNSRVAFIAIALAGLLVFCGVNSHLPTNEDSAIYIDLARSLSLGKGLVSTSGPAETVSNYYPFVYPALLAPVVTLFPGDYAAYKLFSLLLFVLLCLVMSRVVPALVRMSGWQVLLPVVFSAQLCVYGRSVLSEVPYILFSLLALSYCFRFAQEKKLFTPQLVMAGVFVFLASYTRLIGFTLIPAAAAYFLIRKDLRRFFVSLSLLLVLMPWLIQNMAGESAYLREFGERTLGLKQLAARVFYNAAATVGKELPDLFFYPWLSRIDPRSAAFFPKALAGCLIAALCVWGLARKVREEGAGLPEIYVMLYCAVSFAWTHHGARYLLPVLPFLMYYVLIGVKRVMGNRYIVPCACLLVMLNVAGSLRLAWQEHHRPFDPAERSLMEAGDWLRENAAPGALVVSRKPNWLYLYSGIHGVKFLHTRDVARQLVHLLDNNAGYFVVDRNKIYRGDSREYLMPLVAEYPEFFEQVFASEAEPRTLIYRVRSRP